MKLIVGLGNPGSRYEQTRHNIGFKVIDALAKAHDIDVNKKQCRSLLGQGFLSGEKVLLVKPQTYMNNSGEAVWETLNFYRDNIDDLLAIHDDLDLEYGRLRFKDGGGTGGHNGLKSIEKMINSSDYGRLKMGIGRPEQMSVESYVLSKFSKEENQVLPKLIDAAVAGVEVWCQDGLEKAMNKFNGFHINA